ncbi:MAG: protein arginine kinase [Clostridia bacterium]|nr:protein arginine kinase [Clostridia bacterium]
MSNWYLQNGKESDVVISTRIRLARNIKEFEFPNKYSKEESKNILEKLEEITPSLGYGLKFLKLEDIDDITKISLIEKHLLSPEFAMSKEINKGILINDDENICIMINEEDHIRMQVFSAGLDLENLLNLSIEIDEKLENLVNYAYSNKYGYLTSCPTNVGTGMRASVMVHLPALTATGNIGKVLQAVNNFGMNIRGIYGEGSQSQGNVYQIFNNQSLGISEQEIIKNVKAITEKVIQQERLARKYLGKKQIDLENRVYRAYGLLLYSSKLSSEECRRLLSDVKLGTDLGIIKELNDMQVNKLQLYTKPGNLQKYFGKILEGSQRDIRRAEIIKKIIKEENV